MLPELSSVKSIMVRCPNWVGDIVMATPVFETLRHNFPNATITACVRGYARGIIEHGPWFDHVIDCNDKTISGLKSTISQVKEVSPDMAILLPNSSHSYITARLCGIKKIYGYKRNLRRFFLTGGPKPIREGKKYKALPMQDYYLEICRDLELDIPVTPQAMLYTTEAIENEGNKQLKKYGIDDNDTVIGLNPGASFGSSKCWPVNYYAELAHLLEQSLSCKIMLFVGPGEETIAESIVAASSANIINTGPDKIDLAQLKPLIKRCNALVTNDTGPRHYAVAFQVPNIVIMGPTNPLYTASNLKDTIVLRKDLPCSPCHKKVCPIDHRCMTQITPDIVFESVKNQLHTINS